MDQSNEIRKANRKALPKFILLMVISLLIGGGVGFFSAKYGLNALAGGMKNAGLFFGMNIAPWLMLAGPGDGQKLPLALADVGGGDSHAGSLHSDLPACKKAAPGVGRRK